MNWRPSLGYTVSSKLAWAIIGYPQKTQNKQTNRIQKFHTIKQYHRKFDHREEETVRSSHCPPI